MINILNEGVGVFLGVLAGTAVTILVQKFFDHESKKQKERNLKFEFEFNIKKIDHFLEEITKYRNAVNGDNLTEYFGYFDLSRVISVTANSMFLDGSLYNLLDHEDIGKLQVFFSEFSLNGENYMNNQLIQHRNNFDKKKAVNDVNFWEEKFKSSKKTIEEVLKKIK